MDRNANDRMTGPKIGLIMGTALASVALAGCTTSKAPQSNVSFGKAQVALEKGKTSEAVTHAEAAVVAEPRNAQYRAMLGAAYLEAGRFESAATSFDDALELGNSDPRTVLSLALAMTATGQGHAAQAILRESERDLDPADLGLALALAGSPERGVHILTNAVRSGHNNAKVRQNLAYTYALAGNWRAARIMAAEDVPADQLDARLSEWANTAKAEDYRVRVANLLGVSVVADSGQPNYLALGNFSDNALLAEAAAQAPTAMPKQNKVPATRLAQAPVSQAPVSKAPVSKAPVSKAPVSKAPVRTAKVEKVDPSRVADILAATSGFAEAKAAPKQAPSSKPATAKPAAKPAAAPKAAAGPRFVSNPVVQTVPKTPRPVANSNSRGAVAANSSQRRMAVASDAGADTHLVQLGSFGSNADAKRAWTNFQKKFPQLAKHDVVITRAEVKGKTYYRVAAAGFGVRSARSMCSAVKRSGGGCFAYAKTNPPAGAVDRGVRIAARSR